MNAQDKLKPNAVSDARRRDEAGASVRPRPAEAGAGPRPAHPAAIDAAWEGVLDCGAAGPSRGAPALFYQGAAPD